MLKAPKVAMLSMIESYCLAKSGSKSIASRKIFVLRQHTFDRPEEFLECPGGLFEQALPEFPSNLSANQLRVKPLAKC